MNAEFINMELELELDLNPKASLETPAMLWGAPVKRSVRELSLGLSRMVRAMQLEIDFKPRAQSLVIGAADSGRTPLFSKTAGETLVERSFTLNPVF